MFGGDFGSLVIEAWLLTSSEAFRIGHRRLRPRPTFGVCPAGTTSAGAVKPRNRLHLQLKAPTGVTHRTAGLLCRPFRGFVGIRDRYRGLTAPAEAVSAHSGLIALASEGLRLRRESVFGHALDNLLHRADSPWGEWTCRRF
jgi:hypothetical protein